MKEIDINSKGFTLIELLAVITILGILMMVAIPAITRTIENSRRDTFADNAKEYINNVRNSVLADDLSCGGVSVGAVPVGVYWFKIDTASDDTKNLMESGGKSSWSNSEVSGYVTWWKHSVKKAGNDTNESTRSDYSILLVDSGKHGIATLTKEDALSRSKVSTAAGKSYSDFSSTGVAPTSDAVKESLGNPNGFDTYTPVQCTLK